MAIIWSGYRASDWGTWQGPAGGQSTRFFDDFTNKPPDPRWDRSIRSRRFPGDYSQYIPGDQGDKSRAQAQGPSFTHPMEQWRYTEFWIKFNSIGVLEQDDFHMCWEIHTPWMNPGGITTINIRSNPNQEMLRYWLGPGEFANVYAGRKPYELGVWNWYMIGFKPSVGNTGGIKFKRNGQLIFEKYNYQSTTQSGNHYPEIGWYTWWRTTGTDDYNIAGYRIYDTEPAYPGGGGGSGGGGEPPPPVIVTTNYQNYLRTGYNANLNNQTTANYMQNVLDFDNVIAGNNEIDVDLYPTTPGTGTPGSALPGSAPTGRPFVYGIASHEIDFLKDTSWMNYAVPGGIIVCDMEYVHKDPERIKEFRRNGAEVLLHVTTNECKVSGRADWLLRRKLWCGVANSGPYNGFGDVPSDWLRTPNISGFFTDTYLMNYQNSSYLQNISYFFDYMMDVYWPQGLFDGFWLNNQGGRGWVNGWLSMEAAEQSAWSEASYNVANLIRSAVGTACTLIGNAVQGPYPTHAAWSGWPGTGHVALNGAASEGHSYASYADFFYSQISGTYATKKRFAAISTSTADLPNWVTDDRFQDKIWVSSQIAGAYDSPFTPPLDSNYSKAWYETDLHFETMGPPGSVDPLFQAIYPNSISSLEAVTNPFVFRGSDGPPPASSPYALGQAPSQSPLDPQFISPGQNGQVITTQNGLPTWSALKGKYQIIIEKAGNLTVSTGAYRYYIDTPSTILSTRASLGGTSDASVSIDINRNGTTIFTDQGLRPIISSGAYTALGSASTISMGSGDYFTIDIDTVGVTVAGSDLTVQITLQES